MGVSCSVVVVWVILIISSSLPVLGRCGLCVVCGTIKCPVSVSLTKLGYDAAFFAVFAPYSAVFPIEGELGVEFSKPVFFHFRPT